MPEDKKWVLLAEKSDKSIIRNKIARYMGKNSRLEYTPSAEYAELFINDDYQGTYLIGQKVEESNKNLIKKAQKMLETVSQQPSQKKPFVNTNQRMR